MKKILLLTLVVSALAFSACGNQDDSASNQNNLQYDEKNAVTVDEGESFELNTSNGNYLITLKDSDGKEVQNIGPSALQPEVTETEDGLVKIYLNPGTENSYAVYNYYDPVNNLSSEAIFGATDEMGTKVVCVGDNTVIVRDIFDAEELYKEFTEFSEELSPMSEAIISAEFSEDGTSVEVKYYTGSDMTETSETISIN